jgi:hypothetical protein
VEPIDLERASVPREESEPLPHTEPGCVNPYSLLWIAGVATLLLALGAVPAVADEPGPLRWLRTCADHPLRALTAMLLLAHAVRPAGSPH